MGTPPLIGTPTLDGDTHEWQRWHPFDGDTHPFDGDTHPLIGTPTLDGDTHEWQQSPLMGTPTNGNSGAPTGNALTLADFGRVDTTISQPDCRQLAVVDATDPSSQSKSIRYRHSQRDPSAKSVDRPQRRRLLSHRLPMRPARLAQRPGSPHGQGLLTSPRLDRSAPVCAIERLHHRCLWLRGDVESLPHCSPLPASGR